MIGAEDPLVRRELFVELPQHFMALAEAEIDLPGQLIGFSDEGADAIEFLFGLQPTLLCDQEPCFQEAHCRTRRSLPSDEFVDGRARLLKLVGLQQNIGHHHQERRLIWSGGQPLAEHGDGPVGVLLPHGDGGDRAESSFIIGKQSAGLGGELLGGSVSLLCDAEFEISEQHVGIFWGDFGGLADRSGRVDQVSAGLMPSGQREPGPGLFRIRDHQMLEHDRCGGRVFELFIDNARQDERYVEDNVV